jgi:Cytochrome P450
VIFDGTIAKHERVGLPIIGRVHDIDMKRSWFKFKEWGDKYGPIYQTTMMGSTHVWISSHDIAVELLAKRGAIYSDRPGIPHMPGTKDGVEYLPFLKYGGDYFPLPICNNKYTDGIQRSGVDNESSATLYCSEPMQLVIMVTLRRRPTASLLAFWMIHRLMTLSSTNT